MIITSSLVYAALALFAFISNHPPLSHHFPESIKATLSTFAPKLLSGQDLERLWVHFPDLRPPTSTPVDVFAPLAFSPRLFEPHVFEWCDPSSAPPPATRVFGMLFGSKTIEVTNATVNLQVLTAIIAFLGFLLALGTLLTCFRAGPRLPVTETISMIESLDVEPCTLPASVSAASVLEDSVTSTVSPSASTMSASDSFTTAILIPSVSLSASDSTDSFLSYVEPAELGAQSVPASASLSESVSSYASISSLATPAPVTPTTPTTDPSPWIEVRSRSPTPSRSVATPRPTPKAPATIPAGSFRNSFAALQNLAQEDTQARPAPPPSRAPARTESHDARGKSSRRQTKDARPAPPPPPARPAQQRGTNTRQQRQNKSKSAPQTTRTQTAPQTRRDAPAPKAPRPGPSSASTSRTVAKPRTPVTKTQSPAPKASSASPKQKPKPRTAPSTPPPQQSALPADTNLNQPPRNQDASVPRTFYSVLTSPMPEPPRTMTVLGSSRPPSQFPAPPPNFVPSHFFAHVIRQRPTAAVPQPVVERNEREEDKRRKDEDRQFQPGPSKRQTPRGTEARNKAENEAKESSELSSNAALPETSPRGFFIVGHETHRIQDSDRRNADAKNKHRTSSSTYKQNQQSSSQKEQQQASSSQQHQPAQSPQPAQQQDQRERPTLSPMRMTDLRTLLMTEQLVMPQSERRRQQRAVAELLGSEEQSSARASLVGVGYAVRPRKMKGKGKERE